MAFRKQSMNEKEVERMEEENKKANMGYYHSDAIASMLEEREELSKKFFNVPKLPVGKRISEDKLAVTIESVSRRNSVVR